MFEVLKKVFVIFQESEIARLQAKISGLERTLTAMRVSESFSVATPLSDKNYNNTNISHDKGVSQGQNHERPKQEQKDIVLSDLAVTFPNQLASQDVEFLQQTEIQYKKGSQSKVLADDQENIEPSGPVRVLNFTDCDERTHYNTNSGIHRPKPVLPSNVDKPQKELKSALQSDNAKDPRIQNAKTSDNQSAFSRISKEGSSREDKTFPGEKELGMYTCSLE